MGSDPIFWLQIQFCLLNFLDIWLLWIKAHTSFHPQRWHNWKMKRGVLYFVHHYLTRFIKQFLGAYIINYTLHIIHNTLYIIQIAALEKSRTEICKHHSWPSGHPSRLKRKKGFLPLTVTFHISLKWSLSHVSHQALLAVVDMPIIHFILLRSFWSKTGARTSSNNEKLDLKLKPMSRYFHRVFSAFYLNIADCRTATLKFHMTWPLWPPWPPSWHDHI